MDRARTPKTVPVEHQRIGNAARSGAAQKGLIEQLHRSFGNRAVQRLLARQAEPRRNDTGLPDDVKSGVESLAGVDLDSVKVHRDASEPAHVGAVAYTRGTDIYVAPGAERHLPHEAWHVVQQAQGRVQPTLQVNDTLPVNDDRALEQEADVMGARALSVSARTETEAGADRPDRAAAREAGAPV